MNPPDKPMFTPYHYLSDKDLEELRQCELELEYLIKKAHVRKKEGKRIR